MSTLLPDIPTISSVAASPKSVDDTGTQLITLIPSGVADPAGQVDQVTYWLDTPGEGRLDPTNDLYLGAGTADTAWDWNGYLGGISDGTYTVFAVATHFSNTYTFESPPVTTTVTITPGPPYSVVAQPWIDEVQASPDSSATKSGFGVTEDSSGNTRVFWNAGSFPYTQFVREYDEFGHALSAPIALLSGAYAASIVGLPDGSFDEVYVANSTLYAQRDSALAVAVGSPIVVDPDGADVTRTCVAADSAGDLLVVYVAGPSYDQDQILQAFVSASGAVAGPTSVSSGLSGPQLAPSVALDASGAGIVAWIDRNDNAIVALTVSGAGASEGSAFTVYSDPTVNSVSAAVDGQGVITLAFTGPGGVYAERYLSNGVLDGSDIKVPTEGTDQYAPLVAVNSEGWFIIAWDEFRDGEPQDVIAEVYDPVGRPQGSSFEVPNIVNASGLEGLAFGNDGKVAIEFGQVGQSDPNHQVALFRLYKVDQEPVFQGTYHFTVPLNSPVGTVVGTVQAIDPDRDPIDYQQQGNSPFIIDYQTGQITVADASASAIDGGHELQSDNLR